MTCGWVGICEGNQGLEVWDCIAVLTHFNFRVDMGSLKSRFVSPFFPSYRHSAFRIEDFDCS